MKRKRSTHVGGRPPKRTRVGPGQSAIATSPAPVEHPVLTRIYTELVSLRHYLLAQLPRSSKNRRRKISQLGLSKQAVSDSASATPAVDIELGHLLDTALVGACPDTNTVAPEKAAEERDKDIEIFTQQLPEDTAGGTFKPGYFLQAEVVDFVVWRLFKRASSRRPPHLLCHGFQPLSNKRRHNAKITTTCHIPGMTLHYPNSCIETVKGPVWCRLRALLDQGGDPIMMDLLSDCGVFVPVDAHSGNYFQLSGLPVSEVNPVVGSRHGNAVAAADRQARKSGTLFAEDRKPGAIVFVRSRMLYARAALNGKGHVRFGMRHIHVLNRYPDRSDALQTVHILRYMFPRQFGLHNVFTSKVDARETAMPFKDYTLREKDIYRAMERDLPRNHSDQDVGRWKSRIPKRLRGEPVAMVDKLRKLHSRCHYTQLLHHYCPVEGVHSSKPGWRKNPLQPSEGVATEALVQGDNGNESSKSENQGVQQTSFTDMACPTAHVSAFCRAVVAKVIPNGLWGDESNKRTIMYWVDQFVCLRRFESLTLHQILQKLQLSNLAWLRPPGQHTTTKMAKSDFDKRQEIFLELVYWVFDSFLIPLIRSNFHVTESNVHRNRLFYFRHDVWRMLTEPFLSSVKMDLFDEMPTERANRLLSMRPLGYSKIRLLPKSAGVRMITNLKRRQQVMRNGTMTLGRSINSVMGPTFNIINYEKSLQSDRFGSSLFSIGDMFPKLASFRESLQRQGLGDRRLYFAKVDAQSCFDTIPQQRLLSMVESLMSMEGYQTGKHVEVSPLGRLQQLDGHHVKVTPVKRYVGHTSAAGDMVPFGKLVQDKFAGTKANTVFVNTAVQHFETKDDIMHLLREHVERNLIKIGKRFYRQKTGIPQGSVLSSILCNFFYAELERDVLHFALGPGSMLLRLLDDFCLITVEKECAERFLQVMHGGHAEYGLSVKAAKSLTNFDFATEDGYRVPRCVSGVRFPYCGVLIDTRTLEVSKNTERSGRANAADSLTVDLSKVPGQTFHRKALNGFKMQLQAMFIDTRLNRVPTVLANLYVSFHEAAVRSFEYVRSLSKARRVRSNLLIKTVDRLGALAFVMLQRRTHDRGSQNVERVRSVIARRQVQWLAYKAFEAVFQRKQTQHGALLSWLERALAAVRPASSAERRMLESAVTWHAGPGGSVGDLSTVQRGGGAMMMASMAEKNLLPLGRRRGHGDAGANGQPPR